MRVVDGSKSSIISIHALLAESDYIRSIRKGTTSNFYPRSPCGERPRQANQTCRVKISISIHALLAESDKMHALIFANLVLFLSTLSLRRATTISMVLLILLTRFLSTLSLRRATISCLRALLPVSYFYPRSPCGERRASTGPWPRPPNFYPRSPCGERPCNHTNMHNRIRISIHALLAESDWF